MLKLFLICIVLQPLIVWALPDGIVSQPVIDANKTPHTNTKNNFMLPDLASDEAKLKTILTAKKNIPGLFTQVVSYDIDLLTLMEEQNKLQEILKKSPNYISRMNEHHPSWLNISITPAAGQIVKSVKVDPASIARWKTALEKGLAELKVKDSLDTGLKNQIGELISDKQTRIAQGLETGLAMSLSPEDRKKFFVATSDEKLAMLQEKLPSTLGDSFKASNFGLPPNSLRDEALKILVEAKAKEERLRGLTELHLILQNEEGRIVEDPLERIRSLDSQDLQFMADPDGLKPGLEKLESLLPKDTSKGFGKTLFPLIQKNIKTYTSQLISTEEVLGKGLTLKEVPPALGILRGCTGGDCSTKYSFPYPNAPTERVFYVYGDDGNLKGYVTGNLVKANGIPSFNVNTIAGPRISTGDSELILKGLTKAKDKLQAKQITIPSMTQINALINFPEIRAAYRNTEVNPKELTLEYLDKEQRLAIETYKSQYNNGNYDKMDNLSTARIVEEKDFPLRINVTESARAIEEVTPSEMKQGVLELSYDLLNKKRKNEVPRLLRIVHLPEEKIQELESLIKNDLKLSLEKYKEKIKKLFEYSDVQLHDNLPKFFEGILHTEDFTKLDTDPRFFKYISEAYSKSKIMTASLLNLEPEFLLKLSSFLDAEAVEKLTKEILAQNDKNLEDVLKLIIQRGRTLGMEKSLIDAFNAANVLGIEDASRRIKNIFALNDADFKTKVPLFYPGLIKDPGCIRFKDDPLFKEAVKNKMIATPMEPYQNPALKDLVLELLESDRSLVEESLSKSELVFSQDHLEDVQKFLIKEFQAGVRPANQSNNIYNKQNLKLEAYLKNTGNLSVADFSKKIKTFFNYSDKELIEKQHLFFTGYLSSPDLHLLETNPKFFDFIIPKISAGKIEVGNSQFSEKFMIKLVDSMTNMACDKLCSFFKNPRNFHMKKASEMFYKKMSGMSLLKCLGPFSQYDDNLITVLGQKDNKQFHRALLDDEDPRILKLINEKYPVTENKEKDIIKSLTSRKMKYYEMALRLNDAEFFNMKNVIKHIIDVTDGNDVEYFDALIESVFKNRHSLNKEDLLMDLIRKSSNKTHMSLAKTVFSQKHAVGFLNSLELLIKVASPETLKNLQEFALSNNVTWKDSKYDYLRKALTISDPKARESFLVAQKRTQLIPVATEPRHWNKKIDRSKCPKLYKSLSKQVGLSP
jgi:succinate dehydrogenase flavin-adding protein (antitoxin of CptAB toxin-antitoxin module)